MTVLQTENSDAYTAHYLTGILDTAATIYPTALAIKTRDPRVKEILCENFGGRIEASRWITRSVKQRKRLYLAWLSNSKSETRRAAIKGALYDLEHPA